MPPASPPRPATAYRPGKLIDQPGVTALAIDRLCVDLGCSRGTAEESLLKLIVAESARSRRSQQHCRDECVHYLVWLGAKSTSVGHALARKYFRKRATVPRPGVKKPVSTITKQNRSFRR